MVLIQFIFLSRLQQLHFCGGRWVASAESAPVLARPTETPSSRARRIGLAPALRLSFLVSSVPVVTLLPVGAPNLDRTWRA
jgi:hypothetical protein